MITTERVPFRLIQTPCCGALLCYVNPRLPNYCSECGERIYAKLKTDGSHIRLYDPNAVLKHET
jgi:hypothetical protein